jgi:uncharacterized protein YbaP (TraB family)
MRRLTQLFLLLPAFVHAQAQGLLWKIEGQGLQHPSYVVGTVHSKDARAYRHVGPLLTIIQTQDVVAGELDLSSGNETSHMDASRILMPDGKELADFYTPKEMQRVRKALQDKMGPLATMSYRMKPFFLIAFIAQKTMRQDSAMVLDQYLQAQARDMGKEVMGLETAQEQLAVVDQLPLKEQADMLYQAVRSGSTDRTMDHFLDAYAAQDLGRLAKLVAKGEMPELFGKKLLKDRNVVMAQRMDSLMQGGRTFLFAIGAGHLPETDGVLELLRQMGYAVETLKEEQPAPAKKPAEQAAH